MAVYVFHHLPKCGGTASRKAFEKQFRVIQDYRRAVTPEATEVFLQNRVDLASLDEHTMLAGHYDIPGAHLDERYPEVLTNDRFRLVTFIRDPLEVAQSFYFYRRSIGAPVYRSLSEQLRSSRNYIASVLPCTSENYQAVIDRYFFVGLTEHLQASHDMLARMMGKEPVPLGVENVVPRDEPALPEDVATFRANNVLDFKIYAYCQQRFEALRSAHGGGSVSA